MSVEHQASSTLTVQIDESTIGGEAPAVQQGDTPNEDDKAILGRWTAALNDHDPDAGASLLTDCYVRHDPSGADVVAPASSRTMSSRRRSSP
jgi:hypothetical protein